MARLIDADSLKGSIKITNPDRMTTTDNYLIEQLKRWIDSRPTVNVIPKKDLSKAVNKIIKCSMGKWYVGRVDGKTEEVVLLEDVLRILTDLLNEEQTDGTDNN